MSAKARTTIVTFPNGTQATRTSQTRVYSHAVQVTTDNTVLARVLTEQATELERAVVTVTEMIVSGDLSGLARSVSSHNGRGEKFYSSHLPGQQSHLYWLPDHLSAESWSYVEKALSDMTKQAQRRREQVAQLEAGPRVSYHVPRWCSRLDLAVKACAEFGTAEYETSTAVECTEK